LKVYIYNPETTPPNFAAGAAHLRTAAMFLWLLFIHRSPASARASTILQSSNLQKADASFDVDVCYYVNDHVVCLEPDLLVYDW
jgi:hypothetical protein